ncbi:MAG: oligosaccharide flippase family protein [Cyanobacteria bacterium P01_D01_bin.105]
MTNARIASGFKNKLVKGAAGAFGLRLVYTALTFLTSVLLARVLGKSGFGTYTYVVVWAYLLSVPATMGFDNFMVREIAVYRTQSFWGLMKGILKWANQAVLISSCLLGMAAIVVAYIFSGSTQSETFIGFCIAISLMPALSLRNIRRGAMRGLHQITKGLLPELLIDPLILITLTVGAYWVFRNELNVLWIIAFYGVGTSITLIIVSQFLNQALPQNAKLAKPEYKGMAWLSGALPFMLIESIPIINSQTDILMLGAFRGVDAVGLYVPVNRGAQLITFILMAVGSTLSPTIASAYADNRLMDLQRTITKSVRVVAGVAFLFAVTLIVGAPFYLSLFGPEFVNGLRALHILCVGTFISTAIGLSFTILNMTGHERYTATVGWVVTVLNVVLNTLCIPLWGVEGAAFATTTSAVIGGFMSLIAVRKRLGIDATLMGLPAKNLSGR